MDSVLVRASQRLAEFDFNIEMNCVKNIENFSIVLIDYRFNIGTSWYLSTSGFIIGWYIPDIKEKYENIFDNRVRILSFVLFLLSYTCTNTLGVRYK